MGDEGTNRFNNGCRDRMAEVSEFRDWITRIRRGDETAAAELVAKYERLIRTAIRVRIVDPNFGRLFDSSDVCQSVLGSFFARAALGQFDLEEPGQLAALLVKMAKNKVAKQMRWHSQDRRDVHRQQADGSTFLRSLADPADQVRHAEAMDVLREIRLRLTPQERKLVDLRCEGKTWVEIAEELGGDPQLHRKRLQRAVDSLARDVGLDDEADDD